MAVSLASVPQEIPGFTRVEAIWNEDEGITRIEAYSDVFPQDEVCNEAQILFFDTLSKLEDELGTAVCLAEQRTDKQVWYEMIGDNLHFIAVWSGEGRPNLPVATYLSILPLKDAESQVKLNFIIIPTA